jgi:hypothetical protein
MQLWLLLLRPARLKALNLTGQTPMCRQRAGAGSRREARRREGRGGGSRRLESSASVVCSTVAEPDRSLEPVLHSTVPGARTERL